MPDQPKILIVDDEPDNILHLSDMLSNQGYSTVTASSGAEALRQVEQEHPDLVLLDVRLPDISGYQVCWRIREQPTTKLLPVVMLTSLNPDRERINGLEVGADDFLTKPINQAELLTRVRSILRTKSTS
jgi:DNA-binding response OmpR family regulator